MTGLLYHYTDAGGVAGIVKNAVLWATDFRYLNDRLELVYAWDEFVKRLERLTHESGDYIQAYTAQLRALNLMGARDLTDIDDPVYVACLSELGDDLSQWRGYGYHGRGFALGFDSKLIETLQVPMWSHTTTSRHKPIIDQATGKQFTAPASRRKVGYGEKVREDIVSGLLGAVLGICDEDNYQSSLETDIANCIFQTSALINRVAMAKDAVFEGECEHRIYINEHFGARSAKQRRALSSLPEPFPSFALGTLDTVDVQFRPSPNTVFKPYIELPFDRDALKEVVIGPIHKHRLAQETIRRLLDRYAFRDTEIRTSDLPSQE